MAVRKRKLSRTLRYVFHRLFPRHQRSLPVATSVFLGVFIGLMPTLGIALILTALAAQLARVPKGPGLLASFIAVPPTLFLFFYPLAYFGVGLPLLDPPPISFDFLGEVERLNWQTMKTIGWRLWNEASGHVMAFLVGMTIVASAFGLMAFVATYIVMERKRKRHYERRALRRRERDEALYMAD